MIKTPYFALILQYLIPVLYTVLFYFVQIEPHDGSYWQVLFLLGGFYVGNFLLWLDGKVLYSRYNELQTMPKQLISRSALFLLAYVALALFMVTSSGNLLGVGIILALGTTIATEMWEASKNIEYFHKKFLFQVKRQLSPIELNRLTLGFTLFVAVIAVYFLLSASN